MYHKHKYKALGKTLSNLTNIVYMLEHICQYIKTKCVYSRTIGLESHQNFKEIACDWLYEGDTEGNCVISKDVKKSIKSEHQPSTVMKNMISSKIWNWKCRTYCRHLIVYEIW